MLKRCWFLAVVLAATAFVVEGCRSADSKDPKTDARSANLGGKAKSKIEAEDAAAKAHAHYAAGVIHDINEDADAALQEYYEAAKADPENDTLILEVSRRYTQNKQYEKALELLSRAAARPNAPGAIYANLGFIYLQMGKQEQAIAANKAAIKKSPGSLTGYQNLFLSYLQLKQPQEALKVLDEAAKQAKSSIEFLISLSELYANFGVQVPAQKEVANSKALQLLKRAEKMNPRNPPIRLKLADGFNLLGDSAKAAQIYVDVLKTLPDLPQVRERVRAKLTDIYLRSSDRKAAIEQLEGIIRDDPTNAQAYYSLASILYEEKRFAEAAEHFSKTILLNPDFEQAYYDLASSQISVSKTSDALATLERARRRFSQNFVLEFMTGMAFTREKAYGEAVKHFTAAEVVARATEPKRLNQVFYFQLGAAYERKGDYAESEKYFEKCLELAPDFAEALNYLGYMWAERGVKLDKAREFIEKAVKLEPNNAAYLDSLGWVLFKQKQPDVALQNILKATELSEEPDATLYDHLGDVYAALNQPEKAIEAWRKSLSVEANEEVRKKVDARSNDNP
jgi:tetratricopeptide (TPR) repeat protein